MQAALSMSTVLDQVHSSHVEARMSQQGVYSENKLVWWYAREHKLPDAPKQVQLILSDLCNQDCHFCAYRMSGYTSNELFMANSEAASYGHNNPKRWIPTDRALGLIGEFKQAGVLAVQFTGGGEPTVHPDHQRIFDCALREGLRCSLVSNGLKWTHSLIHTTLPHFDWIRVSIDAGDDKSYAETRRTPATAWERVWENISRLVIRCENQEQRPQIGLGFVVTPASYQQIPDFVRLASLSGVDNIRFTAMFSTDEEYPFLGIYDEVKHLIFSAREEYQRDNFAVYDNFGSRFDDLKQRSPDYKTCSYQHYTTYVGADLNNYRCCVYAYNHRGLIQGGNLKDRSFVEFWNSKDRKEDFERFDSRGCERCQFNSKNRQLLYVMGNTASDTSPRHLEFP